MEESYSIPSYWEGDGDNLIDHARRAIERFEETGAEILKGYVWSCLGVGHCFLEDHEAAREYGEKGINLQRETGFPLVLPWQYYFLAMIHLAAGDLERARKCAEESLKLSREFKQKLVEGITMSVLGRIVGEADPSRLDAEAKLIRQGIAMAEKKSLKPWSAQGYLFLGELFAIAGRRDEALENLKKAEAMYLEMGAAGYWLTRTQDTLARLEA